MEEYTNETSGDGEDAVSDDISENTPKKRSRLTGFERTAVAGLVILAVVLAYALMHNSSVGTSYEVMLTWSRSDSTSAYYQVMNKGMLRYSKDGAAMTDKNGNLLWDQIYDMSSPILAMSDNYAAIGDLDGNSIYIFNNNGQAGEVTTDVPIQVIRVSDQGVTAAILSDADSNYINLYDINGGLLSSIRASFENTGYPLTIGFSSDATKLAVSYLCFENNCVSSRIIFYNFSNPDSDHIAGTLLLEGLYPRIEFIGNSKVALYGEYGFSVYNFSSSISEAVHADFDDEINSVFINGRRQGFIFKNNDENGKYRMEIYDQNGKMISSVYFDFNYDTVSANDNEIILSSDDGIVVYQYGGRMKYQCTLDETVTGVMASWENGTYWVIGEQNLKEIRIR